MLNSGFELLILHSHSTDQQLSNFGILSLISVERHFLFIATHIGALYNSLTDYYFSKVKHFAVGFANIYPMTSLYIIMYANIIYSIAELKSNIQLLASVYFATLCR